MAVLKVFSIEKKSVGEVDLSDAVFAAEINPALVHQVVNAQLAGRRRGTASTKTKGEVRGGGRKPFRQKGTGRARQGSTRSPLQPGGGETFGPRPRSYIQAVPRKMAEGAMRSALSDKFKSEKILIVDKFEFKKAQTKEAARILNKNFELKKALVVDSANKATELSM